MFDTLYMKLLVQPSYLSIISFNALDPRYAALRLPVALWFHCQSIARASPLLYLVDNVIPYWPIQWITLLWLVGIQDTPYSF